MKLENWNGHEIRFVEKDGEWWAVLADIADALYLHRNKLFQRLSKDVLSKYPLETSGGTQIMSILNEYGIYEAVFESRKPEAKEFKRWVYGVLKQLRQASGLEAYQTFRLLDKEVQKQAMNILRDGNPKADQKYYIKANTLANKAVSIQYGLPKMIKKEDMTSEMLEDRQKWLNAAVELMTVQEKYHLEFSVSDRLYGMVQGERKSA